MRTKAELAEKSRKFYERNRARIIARMRAKHADNKRRVFAHYGSHCVCCGEQREVFLTIDHINNDGHLYRKNGSRSHNNVYGWLVRKGFPEGFQVLCRNCNWAKESFGECPHVHEGVEISQKWRRAKPLEVRGSVFVNG